ncbi:hypothetical protein ACNHKD_09995 [Methylocystis sp. JAN1]|uniref:hypothetical protein n=1 Tax=Methylocystis sp. JAN1 TaxID=3397211 RepID=UPI003FA2BA18
MDAIEGEPLSPIDLSIEAALELEEMRQKVRSDAPALIALFKYIRTPSTAFQGEGVSMLADIRAYSLLRESAAMRKKPHTFVEFKKYLEDYLLDLERGVEQAESKKVEEAKRFCLALNKAAVAKKMGDLYARRECRNGSSIFDESIS